MKEKAISLLKKLKETHVKYYYWRIDTVLEDAQNMSGEIQDFCNAILQENNIGIEKDDYRFLQTYMLQVLEDYIGALQNQDAVWMRDTLDAGLRELLMVFIDEKDMGDYTYGE